MRAQLPEDRAILEKVCQQPEVRDRRCTPAVRVCEKYGFAGMAGPK